MNFKKKLFLLISVLFSVNLNMVSAFSSSSIVYSDVGVESNKNISGRLSFYQNLINADIELIKVSNPDTGTFKTRLYLLNNLIHHNFENYDKNNQEIKKFLEANKYDQKNILIKINALKSLVSPTDFNLDKSITDLMYSVIYCTCICHVVKYFFQFAGKIAKN